MKCIRPERCVKNAHLECKQLYYSHVSVQVYQLNTGHYLCRNKYYGRGLSIEGFRQALYQYMHNGKGLRQDLFEPILNKLRSLKAVLERQASYRFYSSSLLIIYEGQVSRDLKTLAVNLFFSERLSDDRTLSPFVFIGQFVHYEKGEL